jgi:hypothetical protein
MNILKPVIFFTVISFGLTGCGIKQPSIKKGDKLIVKEELPKETAETQWENSYTDGFTGTIPKGTILEVLNTPEHLASAFDCIPLQIGDKNDPATVEKLIVPENIRSKEGYKSYSFSIKKDYIGSKVTVVK